MGVLAVDGGTPVWDKPWPTWPIYGEREATLLQRALDSGQWAYDGPLEAEFQRGFADYHTARHGVCVTSGTIALQLALEAADIGVGDEVILPANTWQATAVAVLDVNAIPILVDIEPETYMLDLDKAEAAITPRTRAIIPVHLYNNVTEMDRVMALARKHNLTVIEDCAHSHGSRWRGQGVGTVGAMGCFSLQSSKSLNAGEGGIIITNDDQLHERLYSLRNCGRMRPDADAGQWQAVQGGNYRMTEWQAAILCAQFERLPEQVERRHANARILDEQLGSFEGLQPLRKPAQVTRQGMYRYVLRYDAECFNEVPVAAFRRALSAEIGEWVGGVYHPLTQSPLYQPLTKRRYHLSEEHKEALDPARFAAPVAERAYASEAVLLGHVAMLAEPSAMRAIVDACHKLYEHRDELAAWALRDAEG
ncbi:MAG: DegT/DnrJ/EryC1/StrS family aminotransferase [Caldilineaceae bacterium]|nr:DegT/DnrJ/EryC1/StrS family aminotransferase [Caldilineaceae bacterium]